jgi:type IV secretion system protein VirD4
MSMLGSRRPPAPQPPAGGLGAGVGDTLFIGAVLAFAAVLGVVWAGAALAARLAGRAFDADLSAAAHALVALPANMSEPADAWGPAQRDVLPGPVLYWACQGLVLAFAVALAYGAWRLFGSRPERDGLGVERSARFGGRRDIRRLRVKGPSRGRVVLGRVAGRLVATEQRTSVCVVGPSQSHKTSGLCIPALLELGKGDGAVIAASVKGDVWSHTQRRRADLGEVKVFDPTCVVVKRSATWSPLRAAGKVTGAQAAARALVDVAGRGGMDHADFWMQSAKELLWPLLFVAARAELSMRDVVRWVATQDRPTRTADGRNAEGEVQGWLGDLYEDAGTDDEAGELALASDALAGIWATDERTRSSIYTTARTVIEAWSDPVVAKAADGDCEITPEWLLEGDNTLYIVAPARDQARLRPVFACMVADLVHEAFDIATRNGGELPRKLLVLLDEAANICPVRELPAWCSTCPSHGITLLTVWQDRSQQRLRYGREGAETIWNNSAAKVILSGIADSATAEVTAMLGEEEHERMGSSLDVTRGRHSVSAQTNTRRLVSEDALRRQRPGQGVMVYRDLPPMRLSLRPWYLDRGLRALHDGPKPPKRASSDGTSDSEK